jgi:hypothetical protein
MSKICRPWLLVLLALSACAQSATPRPRTVGSQAAVPASARAAWSNDNRWRYHDEGEADAAYQRLLQQQSAWPEWHQVELVTLPAGLRFEMALSPGQPPERPGAFGTFDRIPDVRYVRQRLAVKVAWKPSIDRVATFEIVEPLAADTGTVGPQIDAEAGYLPGGGSQFEMKVPAAERSRHLKLVAIRPIR